MKKISTLLLAALAIPACMSAADIVKGKAQVELWSAKVVNINNEAFSCPQGPRTAAPVELMGTWTSGEDKFSYNPETGHYFIENFLDGGEKCTLEFAVGDTPRDYDVYSTPEEGVNVPLMDPVRYDFEVFFKTADGKETYGLTPADYTGYSIIPNPVMPTGENPGGWSPMIQLHSTDKTATLGNFVGETANYSFKSGLRFNVTMPQRSATGTVSPYEPVLAGTEISDDYGTEAPSMAQMTYVVKDENLYTVYVSIFPNSNNKWYTDGENESTINGAMMFKMSFNKETLAGVDAVIADNENAPVEYYNIQGVKVENPANGLYIKRQGEKVTKVIVK